MLPSGFYWAPRWQHSKGDDGLFLDGQNIAFIDAKADGRSWFARLELQKPFEHPLVLRDCTSLEAGRRGCELWAIRHEERLRLEVAARIAARPCKQWCART